MSIQRTLVSVEPTSPRTGLRGVRVLLVDDDADALTLTEALLVRSGAAVSTAESVEQALHLLGAFRPNVIVSDIDMPGANGYQFMRMVRSRTEPEGGRTPAIALTGYTRDEDHTKALLAGYQTHLAKPITTARLLAAIDAVVDR